MRKTVTKQNLNNFNPWAEPYQAGSAYTNSTTNPFGLQYNNQDQTNGTFDLNYNNVNSIINPFGLPVNNQNQMYNVPNLATNATQQQLTNADTNLVNNNNNANVNKAIKQNMPSYFNGTQEQWDALSNGEQQAQIVAGMGNKTPFEQYGSLASGVGSVMGGVAGLYGAYENSRYQKRQEAMQNRILNSEDANKSAFARAAGGTYIPA
jgi:hypothetical protein